MKENSVLEMKNIYKSFPGVKALQAVDFTLCEGEIHALMGENAVLGAWRHDAEQSHKEYSFGADTWEPA